MSASSDPAWLLLVVAAVAVVLSARGRSRRPLRRLWCRLRDHRWEESTTWLTKTLYRPSRTCRRCGRVVFTGGMRSGA